jgi:hypothetical protein
MLVLAQAHHPGPGSSPGKNFLAGLAELPVGSGIGRGGSSFASIALRGKGPVTAGGDLRSSLEEGREGNLLVIGNVERHDPVI